jgi:hypothetical protein
MKRYSNRFQENRHASKARHAEEIGKKQRGNLAVILTASYLHDIGIKEAERKYQSTGAKYKEEEGPPIAREILSKLGAKDELIEEVCDIIAHHHHPRPEESVNFRVLYDADMITNLEEEHKDNPLSEERLSPIIEKSF